MNRKFLLLFALSQTAFSQNILWDKSLGGNASDVLYDLTATPDNGFIISGASHSSNSGNLKSITNGNYDYSLWKLNSIGEIEWNENFGGSDKDLLQKVILTNDGGYLLLGTSFSKESDTKSIENFGEADVWILKLNAAGNTEWQAAIGGSGIDKFNVIQTIGSKEFIIGMTSESRRIKYKHSSATIGSTDLKLNHYGGADAIVLSINKDGKLNWYKNFGGKYTDEIAALNIDDEQNLLIGINSNSDISSSKKTSAKGQKDIWVVKLDENQKEIAQYSFGGNLNDELVDIVKFKDNLIFVANSNSPAGNGKKTANAEGYSIWTFTIDKDGFIENETEIKEEKMTKAANVINYNNQELIVAASSSKSKEGEDADFYMVSINQNLKTNWEKSIENNKNNVLKSLVKLRDDSFLLAGTSNSNTMGKRSESFGNNDFWIVKLGNKENKLKQLPSLEAFPNPASDYVNVVLGFEYEVGNLSLFDISGRQILTQKINNNTVPVNLNQLPQGVYIIDVKTNTKSESIKIIKK